MKHLKQFESWKRDAAAMGLFDPVTDRIVEIAKEYSEVDIVKDIIYQIVDGEYIGCAQYYVEGDSPFYTEGDEERYGKYKSCIEVNEVYLNSDGIIDYDNIRLVSVDSELNFNEDELRKYLKENLEK